MAHSRARCRPSFLIQKIHLQPIICRFAATFNLLYFLHTPRRIISRNSFRMASCHNFCSIGLGWFQVSSNVVGTSALVSVLPINARIVSAASSNLINSDSAIKHAFSISCARFEYRLRTSFLNRLGCKRSSDFENLATWIKIAFYRPFF